MTPGRDTEPTPPLPDWAPPPPPEGRAKRESTDTAGARKRLGVKIFDSIGEHAGKTIALAFALVAVLLWNWIQRIDTKADNADKVAGVAAAQGAAAVAPAAQAKVEATATFGAAKELTEAVTALTAQVNSLSIKVEKLEAARARRPRRRLCRSPSDTDCLRPIPPPPPLAATAAKQATDPPPAAPPATIGDPP